MARKRLGEALQARGKISAAKVQQLVSEQGAKLMRLGELVLERVLVEKLALVEALEEVSHLKYLDVAHLKCDQNALKLVPYKTAVRLRVLPIRVENSRIVVAMSEPQNIAKIDGLRFLTSKDVVPYFAFRSEIISAIEREYVYAESPLEEEVDAAVSSAAEDSGGPGMTFQSPSHRQSNREAIEEVQAELRQNKTPAVRLVSHIIQAAMMKQASDIHIEPQAEGVLVRLRVDGVLRELESAARNLHMALVSRIKILPDMDIAERRLPQDGRFLVTLGERHLDMRVSTLPTQFGEKVVMRLLETDAPLLSFAQLGFPPDIAENVARLIAAPQGMLLVTGPTGSGKSTTLYSALNLLRRPAVNIVTVEDPIEYVLPGVNQVHVNTKAGLTFASSLRSILRQDPNVIMVGEIRDGETAEIAMKAAQTGHMVLSTLHTNNSISALARLLDLGVPGYLIEASVSGILAQRLVRKLCVCRRYEAVPPGRAANLTALGWTAVPHEVAAPVGCSLCDDTGYRGRVGIYELLVMDDAIRETMREGFRANVILSIARASGMRRMQEDAIAKVQSGVTSLEEVQRVVTFETLSTAICAECKVDLLPNFLYCPQCGSKRVGERLEPASTPSPNQMEGALVP